MSTFIKKSMEELNRPDKMEANKQDKFPYVLVLDSIRSLNNVGSIFRTSDSFNVAKVYLCGLTGQPPHREIQKTALGATESVLWEYFPSISDCIQKLRDDEFIIVAIEQTKSSTNFESYPFQKGRRYAFILGNEVTGVSEEALESVDLVLEIPQFGSKHSLNVSVTAGIVCWKFVSETQLDSIF
jgi:tRNA G18 (ribose-2'-O)-methylase SpoU